MTNHYDAKRVHDPFHLLGRDSHLCPQEKPLSGQLVFWKEEEGDGDE